MNRQSWTCQEDEAICKLVAQCGLNDWTKIASKLKENYCIAKRTGKQCRQRWYNHLNPAVNKKPWNSDQENKLFQLHKVHGNRWKDISRCFSGRTDNDIKNHFYSTLRRSLRRLNKILGEKNSTSQMRQIKPSVLSTIMNYIYEQEGGLQNDLFKSLQDLPSLIFQFANFKPIKTNLKMTKVEDAREKIAEIFELISRFNEEYEQSKIIRHQIKLQRRGSRRDSMIGDIVPTPQTNYAEPKQIISQSNLLKIEGEVEKQQIDGQQNKKHFKTETSLRNEQVKIQEESLEQFCKIDNQVVSEQNYQSQVSYNHNMSLEDDELALLEFQDPEQPSFLSATDHCIDLTIVGRHWEPKTWEVQSTLKQFVDEVLQINYEMQ